MMRVSGALGVNCTFCHNTQSFAEWSHSRVQKQTAWYGIRMVRQANSDYIQPLATVFPVKGWDEKARLGPMGDPLKVNCQTCHQGYSKPLGGVSMLADNPSLREVWRAGAPAPAPTPTAVIAAGAASTPSGVVGAKVVATGAAAEAVVAKADAVRSAMAPQTN
jgi:photosynthetic reaction center cytochrome c subunit